MKALDITMFPKHEGQPTKICSNARTIAEAEVPEARGIAVKGVPLHPWDITEKKMF